MGEPEIPQMFKPMTSPWLEADLEEIDPAPRPSDGRMLRRWRVKEGRFLAGAILWEVPIELVAAELVEVKPLPAPSGLIFYMDMKYKGEGKDALDL